MPTIVVCYFNHRERRSERRSHEVADLCRPTIEAVVDLFDAQVGTVLGVYHGDRCLHRSVVQLSDLM